MPTKADLIRAEAFRLRGHSYEWGEVPGDKDADPNDADCSGQFFHLVHDIGGYGIARMTADDYAHYPGAVKLAKPSKVGDYGVFFTAGTTHAHHICTYIGDPDGAGPQPGQESEARGEAYGQRIYTVAEATARGAVWMRLPNADFGAITIPIARPPGYVVVAWVSPAKVEHIHMELGAHGIAHVAVGTNHDVYNRVVADARRK